MSYIAHFRPSSATRIFCGVALLVGAAGCHHSRAGAPVGPSDTDRLNVGYGTQPRRAVTGAIESATSAEMADRRAGRAEEMFRGRFAGVDVVQLPNGEYTLRIRGSHREPLVVIDGIPSPLGLPNPLRDLAPSQIASVTVLKDAGSTAAYGVRGAGGVILINIKRAR